MRVMFSRENWKEKLNIRKSWKMAGQSLGQISCWLLKVEMVMESVQEAQGCMLVKPPSMYLCGEDRRPERTWRTWGQGTTRPLGPTLRLRSLAVSTVASGLLTYRSDPGLSSLCHPGDTGLHVVSMETTPLPRPHIAPTSRSFLSGGGGLLSVSSPMN